MNWLWASVLCNCVPSIFARNVLINAEKEVFLNLDGLFDISRTVKMRPGAGAYNDLRHPNGIHQRALFGDMLPEYFHSTSN